MSSHLEALSALLFEEEELHSVIVQLCRCTGLGLLVGKLSAIYGTEHCGVWDVMVLGDPVCGSDFWGGNAVIAVRILGTLSNIIS